MTRAAILGLLLHLYGPAPRPTAQRRLAWARAIHRVALSTFDGVQLAVVGWHENHLHVYPMTRTPYFGLVTWAALAGRPPTLDEGARVARDTLWSHWHLACAGMPLSYALGRYHHGTGGRDHGCWPDALSRREAAEIERGMAWALAGRRIARGAR